MARARVEDLLTQAPECSEASSPSVTPTPPSTAPGSKGRRGRPTGHLKNSSGCHSCLPVGRRPSSQQSDSEGESPQLVVPKPPPRGCQESQLPRQSGNLVGRKTLVLDLDETLVHSSFREAKHAEIVVSIDLEDEIHDVFVHLRPGVHEFLREVSGLYEVVVYTASMSKYADPVLDRLDREGLVHHRLFREACTRITRGYVKDLSRLGRALEKVIIVDNSPLCYSLQPDNAIPIKTWTEDPDDRELFDLVTIFKALVGVDNIPEVLKQIIGPSPPQSPRQSDPSSRPTSPSTLPPLANSSARGVVCAPPLSPTSRPRSGGR